MSVCRVIDSEHGASTATAGPFPCLGTVVTGLEYVAVEELKAKLVLAGEPSKSDGKVSGIPPDAAIPCGTATSQVHFDVAMSLARTDDAERFLGTLHQLRTVERLYAVVREPWLVPIPPVDAPDVDTFVAAYLVGLPTLQWERALCVWARFAHDAWPSAASAPSARARAAQPGPSATPLEEPLTPRPPPATSQRERTLAEVPRSFRVTVLSYKQSFTLGGRPTDRNRLAHALASALAERCI
jgi:hypothetical protein